MSQATDRQSAPQTDPPRPDPEPRRSPTAVQSILLALGVLVVLGALGWYTGIFSGDEGEPQPPDVVAPIADGEWFAMVTVGTDEAGEVTLGVDLAEMLGGEEARLAAIEDGVIEEGEELPNDFYIRNPETVYELVHFSDAPQVTVISAVDPGSTIAISPEELLAVYSGEKVDDSIYGIVAGQPIVMDLTISDGVVAEAAAVYLP